MSCLQCGETSKYKCPTCRQPYCSVPCCKRHKETPCAAPAAEPQASKQEQSFHYEFPTDDTVPHETLQLLGKSAEVKKCLENPHVRKILELLDKSPYPDQLMQEYMIEPIFTEFVDACLNVVQPHENSNNG